MTLCFNNQVNQKQSKFLFPHRPPESSYFFTQFMIMSMRISNQFGFFKIECVRLFVDVS